MILSFITIVMKCAKSKTNRKKDSLLRWIEDHLTIVLVLSIVVVIVFPYVFSLPAFCEFFELHKGNSVGDAIGGITAPIIGIISILLLCITLKAQKDAEYRSALENRIFQMLAVHRKNVEEMYSRPQNLKGEEVFKLINDQIEECIIDIDRFLGPVDLLEVTKEDFREKLELKKPSIDYNSFVKLDIAYSIVFLGVRNEYVDTLRSLLSKRYDDTKLLPLLNYLRLKPVKNYKDGFKEWETLNEQSIEDRCLIVEEIWGNSCPTTSTTISRAYPILGSKKQTIYYWGHEFRLGHYFRQLYSTVEYIDSQKDLSENDKYDYIKLLRIQLLNSEQKLLMANSISDLGGNWELFREEEDGKRYISDYHLIKNIPQKVVYGVKYREIYPDIKYEI